MSLAMNDMVKINYTAMKKEDNSVFDTTIESVAKAHDIYDEKLLYTPCLIIIGKNWLPPGVEEQLIGMKENEKKTFTVEAKKGFGLKDRSKIRLIQRREFQRLQIKPKENMKVEVGGSEGRILKVSSSRVKVDFNHDLAGHDLVYEVEIIQCITDIKAQFIALLEKRLPGLDFSTTKIELDKKKIIVELPKESRFMEYIQFIKNGVTRDIAPFAKNYEVVEFIEKYTIEQG